MKRAFTLSMLASVILSLAACGSDDSGSLHAGGNPAGGDPPADPSAKPAPDDPALCTGRAYVGFASTKLHEGRVAAKIGENRGRVKPFGALKSEYARVLGAGPASLVGADATFASAPARWYAEPAANAVALKTSYDIAFDGCLDYVAADPKLAAAPSTSSAAEACAAMARKFWSKTPAPQEIQACVDVAVTGAASEPAVSRKWAYACASVLTSAGFLTY